MHGPRRWNRLAHVLGGQTPARTQLYSTNATSRFAMHTVWFAYRRHKANPLHYPDNYEYACSPTFPQTLLVWTSASNVLHVALAKCSKEIDNVRGQR